MRAFLSSVCRVCAPIDQTGRQRTYWALDQKRKTWLKKTSRIWGRKFPVLVHVVLQGSLSILKYFSEWTAGFKITCLLSSSVCVTPQICTYHASCGAIGRAYFTTESTRLIPLTLCFSSRSLEENEVSLHITWLFSSDHDRRCLMPHSIHKKRQDSSGLTSPFTWERMGIWILITEILVVLERKNHRSEEKNPG